MSSGKHVHEKYIPFGVCRGIPIFLIFVPKHTLCVILRAASARRFKRVPTIYVLGKNKKNIKFLLIEFSIFTAKKSLYKVARSCLRNENLHLFSL